MEIEKIIDTLVSAASGGEWSIFAAAVIMVLVYLLTKVKFVKSWLPKAAKPWVAAGAGALASVATTVISTDGEWGTALLQGLVTGSAAVGLWEMVAKRFLKKDDESDSEESSKEDTAEENS